MGVADWLKIVKDAALATASAETKAKLLEAYNAALELTARNQELESRVRELEARLAFKGTLRFERNVAWSDTDPNPFCSGCWDGAGKAVRLTRGVHNPVFYACPVCRATFDTTGPPLRMPRFGPGPEDE